MFENILKKRERGVSMKLGIAGAGMIVKEVLPVLNEVGIDLKGICATKRSEEKLKELSEKHRIENYYLDFDEMLGNSDIDTIYVALPNVLHYEFCKKALEAGKHVICEKPFTVKYEELAELNKMAEDKNLILIEAITNQYLENYLAIKKRVSDGELGDVKLVAANYSQYSSRYDNFKKGIISPSFDPKFAGGSLMDLNIYNIHFICGIFGKPESVSYAPIMENNIDVSGILTLGYEDFKCVAIASKSCNCDNHMQIQGTKAAITMDRPANECSSYGIFVKGKGTEIFNENKYEHRMHSEFVEFERIINEKDYEKAGEMMKNSLVVMEVIDKARKFL